MKIFEIIGRKIKAIDGLFIIRKIIKRNHRKIIVFIGGFGIGDACLEATFLDSFYKKENKELLIVCCTNQKRIVSKISDFEILSISKKQAERIAACYSNQSTNYYCIYMYKKYKLLIADPWYYIKWPCQYIQNLDVLSIMKYATFRLNDYDCRVSFPRLESNIKYNRFNDSKKTIILNPYSNSMAVEPCFFEMITNELLNNGYSVYTNVFGNQKEIKGSKRLECSVEELYHYSSYVDSIISVRSGILDYIISRSKRMFVLYDDLKFFNLYTLKQWESKCKLYEYRLTKNNYKYIKDKILEEMSDGD